MLETGHEIEELYPSVPRRPESLEGGFASVGSAIAAVYERAKLAMDLSSKTESPIETLIGVALYRYLSDRFRDHKRTKFAMCAPHQENTISGDHVLLMPQYPWRQYRADWAIKATFLERPYCFVECDGRQFHTSPEQIARDKARDATMRLAGIRVMRFTGSDIHRHADACAKLAYAQLQEQYRLEWERGLHRDGA